MKKRILLVGLSVMMCFLAGCLEVTPLTEKEIDIVAEYAASVLLQNDKKYSTPLYYAEEREVRLTPTPTPEPTPVKPKPTKAPDVQQSTQGTSDPDQTPKATVTPTPIPLSHDDPETGRQLTEILAVENISVSCTGYETMKSVQSTEYFSLVAKEGRQYVVVSFLLSNNTDKELVFDASKNNLDYSIRINTNPVSRVSLSMLENDLQYMAIPVSANGTAEAVLVFEVKEEEMDTMHLIIENDSDDAVFVKLK